MSEKQGFLEAVLKSKVSMTKVCKTYGVARSTGYALLTRFKKEGWAGLEERSRQPKTSPRKTPKLIEDFILCIRDLNPTWGGVKLANYLIKKGYTDMPSARTIDRILKRHGRITIDAAQKHQEWTRFEREEPNDLWQMDFKGHFGLKQGRCHPLTLLDDHSRYSLLIRACLNEQGYTVKQGLIETFRHYGLPKQMTMDNGPPWGYSRQQLYTRLTVWLMRLGIYVSHSRPGHPQTQGKLERFHRTLKQELLSRYYFETILLAQEGFDWWRRKYNEERPHAAIGNEVPACRYKRSHEEYPEALPPIEYDESYEVRRVQKKGIIYYKGKLYLIGAAFDGYPIALTESDKDGLMDVYFCQQRVLQINLEHDAK